VEEMENYFEKIEKEQRTIENLQNLFSVLENKVEKTIPNKIHEFVFTSLEATLDKKGKKKLKLLVEKTMSGT
jgi:hypothetical protein